MKSVCSSVLKKKLLFFWLVLSPENRVYRSTGVLQVWRLHFGSTLTSGLELSFAPHPETGTRRRTPGCWRREEVPGRGGVPLLVPTHAVGCSVLLGRGPEKGEGCGGAAAAAGTPTPAQRGAEARFFLQPPPAKGFGAKTGRNMWRGVLRSGRQPFRVVLVAERQGAGSLRPRQRVPGPGFAAQGRGGRAARRLPRRRAGRISAARTAMGARLSRPRHHRLRFTWRSLLTGPAFPSSHLNLCCNGLRLLALLRGSQKQILFLKNQVGDPIFMHAWCSQLKSVHNMFVHFLCRLNSLIFNLVLKNQDTEHSPIPFF